jgi:LacI family transcriptional regulator
MTVSRALRDDPRVSPTTRERVMSAVVELGYRRNELARNLRLGRNSGLVGLVVTNLANPFYSQLALGVEAVTGDHGLKVVLGNTGEDPQRERRLVEELTSRRVDGMIVVPAGGDHSHLERREVGAPVVLAARPPANLSADCVLVDDFGGARDATARLLASGVRRPAFLGLPSWVWTTSERLRGFGAAVEEAGLELDDRFVRRHRGTIASAQEAATELLSLPDPPDGLFCANSRTTMGAFRAVTLTGAQLALAGFDDFELADMLGVPLILVAYDPGELGRQAARLLEERMTATSDAELPPRRVVIPTTVVEYGRS